ncbi:protein seele [Cephus cinctus]|uniref:Protein seele n=1 Tax=Cephus cinctus TaxID=211228 RepID=A0AAJ7RP15_CEPCN|nr:protein seele [Cephus cinctus]
MKCLIVIAFAVFVFDVVRCQDIDSRNLRCLVCRTTIDELTNELSKISPEREIEVGNFRLDGKGNTIRKKVPLARSEVHISNVLDEICGKLSDYVRARYKSNGQLTILNLLDSSGGMNPEIAKVDIIQDSDLNKSLKYHCEAIIEEFEDGIVNVFRDGGKDADIKVCSEIANLCDDTIPDDEENKEGDASEENLGDRIEL